MRSRTALLPLLAFAVWVSLALPGGTQTLTCRALPLAINTVAPGDQLGCSLAVSSIEEINLLFAGSNLADDPRRGMDVGSVTRVRQTSDVLTVFTPLFAPDAAPGDQFGFALSSAGGTLAVGARFGDAPGVPDAGAVYVFDGEDTFKLTAQDARPGAQFGASVALSGEFLAVGAPQDDARGTASGAVYVFRNVLDPVTEQFRWRQQAKLVSSRTMPFDNFGASIALSLDTLAVGAPFADGAGGGAGAVHVFSLFDFLRPEREIVEVQILTASDAAAGDQLGFSVALAGSLLAAGARRDDHDGLTDAGSVVLFQREEIDRWTEGEKITAGAGAQSGDLFGGAVALGRNQLVVGASRADGDSGAAYLFALDDGEVFPLGRIPPPPGGGGRFGFSVAASRGIAAAGAFAARNNAGEISLLDCSVPVPGLTVDLSDGVEIVHQGQTVTYRIRVANAPAGTRVVDLPSARLDRLEWCPGEGCTGFTPGAFSEILSQGGDAAYTVRGQVRSGTRTVIHRVQVLPPRESGASPLLAEDRDRVLFPDLACFQSEPDLAVVGDLVSSTLVVSNGGPGPATRVLLQDPAPAGFETVAMEGPCSGFPCDLGTIPPGGQTSIVVQFRIPPKFAPVPQTVEKITTVRSGEAETRRTNNDCRFRIQVYPLGISPP